MNSDLSTIIKQYQVNGEDFLNNVLFVHTQPGSDGGIYKKIHDQYGNVRWLKLLNKFKEWGWYYVNEPFLDKKKETWSRNKYHMYSSDFYHEKNISYFIDYYKNIYLFLHTEKGELIAFLTPERCGKKSIINQWKMFSQKDIRSQQVNKQFKNSWPIYHLPVSTSWSTSEEDIKEHSQIIETRSDPWNYKQYTYNEFYAYYGRDIEWEFQDPIKVLQRKKINDMIFKYRKVLSEKNMNHLLDQIIVTFI